MLGNISEGIWAEGNKIPSESTLCEMFQASRISIRSAIKILQGQGFLITRPGIGSFVNIPRNQMGIQIRSDHHKMDMHDCRQYLDFRLLLECEAVRLFCLNASRYDHDLLITAQENMRDFSQTVEMMVEADIAFHLAIFKGAKNPYLYNAINANINMFRSYFEMVLRAVEAQSFDRLYDRHCSLSADLINGRANNAILTITTELNYCYNELFAAAPSIERP